MRKKAIYIKFKGYKIKWNTVLSSLISVGLLWNFIGIFFMIISEITNKLKILMPFIGYTKDSKFYYLFNGIHQMKNGVKILSIGLLIDIVIIIVLFLYLIQKNLGEKLLVIEHTSLQNMSFTYDLSEMDDYVEKRFKINQYKTISDITLRPEDKIVKLIKEIDEKVIEINKYIDNDYQIGYAGIPVGNIPCVFLLGYKLDDANKKLYFHKFRNNGLDDNFHIMRDEPCSISLVLDQVQNNPNKTGKILVIIQLTQPIKNEELEGVIEDNDFILRYSIPNQIDYDIVSTARQINEYVDQIVKDISERQKVNITAIKICVAASSDFIFALGTKFSKTQNIDTIIYQFDRTGYSWGINVTRELPVINSAILQKR